MNAEEKQRRELIERVEGDQKLRAQIKAALADGPQTVPELARRTGLPADVVLWHLTAGIKYGGIAAGEPEGDYPRYRLVKD